MSIYPKLLKLGRRIVRAIPFTSTPASRMWRRAQHHSHWSHAPPHQQPQAFAQHQQTLSQLKHQHLAHKIAPPIIDALYALLRPTDGQAVGQIVMLLTMLLVFRTMFVT